jgi:hypothetical protein
VGQAAGLPAEAGSFGHVRRSGLTLLELLIALGLGVLLIASVGATLTIYLRTETQGRERMQRAQIVRSLYRRMSDDLRDVVYLEQITSQSQESGMTAAEETEQADLEAEFGLPSDYEEYLTPSEALGAKTNGLYGDSNSLVIYIKRPRRLPPRVAARESTEEDESLLESAIGSGLRCVSWYQNDVSSVGAMVDSIMLDSFETEELADPDGSVGLCRLDHDAYDLQTSEDVFSLLSNDAQLLAPEVAEVQFRYFDGVDWVEEWDSALQERLPNAVEVTLTFEAAEIPENQMVFEAPPEDADNTVRFVIALPLAPPPLTEVEL